jgi:hypothetical protein
VPGATPSKLALGLGKNGFAYLVDRENMGGFGQGVWSGKVSTAGIISVAAAYNTAKASYVVFQAFGVGCPPGSDLVAFKITAASPPALALAWCGRQDGVGGPIVTTTDGVADPIVWGYGADGTGRLWAYNADTGESVMTGSIMVNPLIGRRLIPPIVAKGRLYIVNDRAVLALMP